MYRYCIYYTDPGGDHCTDTTERREGRKEKKRKRSKKESSSFEVQPCRVVDISQGVNSHLGIVSLNCLIR